MAYDVYELDALRGALYQEADALADAWRTYADELLVDLLGDEPLYGRRRVLDAQSRTHEAFGTLETMVCKAHPERRWWQLLFRVPFGAEEAIRAAGITTLGELLDEWWAGTLAQVPGVGPATIRYIGRELAKLQEEGLVI
jgi:hypothetical protein